MNEKELKKQITIGVILIIIGISFFINDFIKEKREKVFSAMNLELTELFAYEEENTDEESTEDISQDLQSPGDLNIGDVSDSTNPELA